MQERKGIPLHTKILIGLLLGAIIGGLTQWWYRTTYPQDAVALTGLVEFAKNYARPVGSIFLYLIFMIVVPLLFSALVLGVADLGASGKVGRIGFRALAMTVVLSGIAVLLGIGLVNLFQPGKGIDPAARARLESVYMDKESGQKNLETAQKAPEDPPLLGFIPRNPIKEVARDGLLPFMFFALIFGIALAAIEPEKALPVVAFLEGMFAASLKIIDFAMRLAPYGVFALVFATASTLGFDALLSLGKYVLVVLFGLAVHLFITYGIVVKVMAGWNPLNFFRKLRTVMLTAFGTSSSNATLPVALKSAEDDLGLPRDVSSFVLTVGATANQNGTALFEGITVLFLAQFFNVDLTFTQQLIVMGLSIVGGIGTAGVPGGSWPFIAVILMSVKVPVEAIGLVIGIDRILDMSRTVLNVTGDLTIATCVSAWEERSAAKASIATAQAP